MPQPARCRHLSATERGCDALIRSFGGCGGRTPRGGGAPVSAPQVIAKEYTEQFKLTQRNSPARLVHLLPLRRRLRLQPLDGVEDPVPRLGTGHVCPRKAPLKLAGLFAGVSVAPKLEAIQLNAPYFHNAQRVRKFRPFPAPLCIGSQLQKQIARRRTTIHVTGLSGPTMNCITGLFLRLIIFPP
jgi:hypothetical protein